MLEIFADGRTVVFAIVLQPVFAADVKGLTFLCLEGGELEREFVLLVEVMSERGSPEESMELVFLHSIEIDVELFNILRRTETCVAVGRCEVVVVQRNHTHEVKGPPLVRTPGYVGLVIQVLRFVFTFGVECVQKIGSRLVAHAMKHGELVCPVPSIGTGTQQAGSDGSFETFDLLILNVKHAGHLLAVFCLETASRETYTLHKVGVDDAETFLLSGTDEQRTIDFDAIDIDGVFVERTTTDIVLRTHLVVCAHTSLCGDHLLNARTRGIAHVANVFDRHIGHRVGLSSDFGHIHLTQFNSVGEQHDVERHSIGRILQHPFACLIAKHGKHNYHTISRFARKAIASL